MKATRFYYVGTGRADIVHRSCGRMNGDITFCGTWLRQGWKWWLSLRNVPKGSSVCARCEASKQNRYG
jgi:hypothetical protein